MGSDASFETKTENGIAVVSINGWLDNSSISGIDAEAKKLIDTRHHKLVLDFGEVNYINRASVVRVFQLCI